MKKSNPKTPFVRILAVIAVLAAVALTGWLVATGGCSDPTANSVDAGAGEAKTVTEIEREPDDLVFQLDGNNTDIKWTGSNSIGQKPTGYFYNLTGTAIVNTKNQRLKSLQITIDMNGVKAMSNSLTKKLKHKGFFEVDKYPEAKFVSTSVRPGLRGGDSKATDWVVEGNFQLKDVTQSVSLPLQISMEDGNLKLASDFSIDRKKYGVIYSDSLGDKLIRDTVLVELSIDSSMEETIEETLNASPAVQKVATQVPENYTETIKATLVEFDMIFVPGDEAAGIEPFHIGKTEVTWEEFDYWALCKNMSDKDSIEAISMQLRPSAPHDLEKTYRGWGRDSQPVVGVSRLSAELYCKWLSKETGKTYRLPTSQEWNHAFELGGYKLDETFDSNELLETSWFDENAVATDEEGFDQERAMPVATLKPNKLGIYDMLGNVSEWVIDTGEEKTVRGGHFKMSADELTGGYREIEDQNIWNKDYPNDPKSKWWYVNADYVGFRVVCESD